MKQIIISLENEFEALEKSIQESAVSEASPFFFSAKISCAGILFEVFPESNVETFLNGVISTQRIYLLFC